MYEQQKQPLKELKEKTLLEFEKTLIHRSNNSPEQKRRILKITIPRRKYTSVNWMVEIVEKDHKRLNSILSQIKSNLLKKQKLLDIMRCLITDAMIYHKAEQFSRSHHIGKVKMQAKIKNKWQNRERTPIFVKVDIPSIARRLRVSDILIWKYIQGMEKVGLIQRPNNIKKYSSILGSYRIIGGYFIPDQKRQAPGDENLPKVGLSYFWGSSQPGIKEKLIQFSLGVDKTPLYSQNNSDYIVTNP